IVYDITGKQVHIDQSNRFAGNQQQVLNLSSLNAGTYILSVQLSGQSFTKRFIKK
ncbi:MAG: Secretion system C-terminal sorting domain, partial [Bacteroidota bacterium]